MTRKTRKFLTATAVGMVAIAAAPVAMAGYGQGTWQCTGTRDVYVFTDNRTSNWGTYGGGGIISFENRSGSGSTDRYFEGGPFERYSPYQNTKWTAVTFEPTDVFIDGSPWASCSI